MANTSAAKKYIKASRKRRIINDIYRKNYRQAIKKIIDKLQTGKFQDALKLYPLAQKAIDKAIKKGVLKQNTGSRKKRNLVKKIKSQQA